MTPSELHALVLASGLSKSEFARRVGMTPRNFRRILSGEQPVLERTVVAARAMLGAADEASSGWPRDEWIVGEGPPPGRREYVIHTVPPRFIARAVAMDELTALPEPDEEPVDTREGIIYQAGDSLICEVSWLDAPPADPTALRRLLDRTADQLEWDTIK
jgi:transcriptional regulator with XRE-family HTH domain